MTWSSSLVTVASNVDGSSPRDLAIVNLIACQRQEIMRRHRSTVTRRVQIPRRHRSTRGVQRRRHLVFGLRNLPVGVVVHALFERGELLWEFLLVRVRDQHELHDFGDLFLHGDAEHGCIWNRCGRHETHASTIVIL